MSGKCTFPFTRYGISSTDDVDEEASIDIDSLSGINHTGFSDGPFSLGNPWSTGTDQILSCDSTLLSSIRWSFSIPCFAFFLPLTKQQPDPTRSVKMATAVTADDELPMLPTNIDDLVSSHPSRRKQLLQMEHLRGQC